MEKKGNGLLKEIAEAQFFSPPSYQTDSFLIPRKRDDDVKKGRKTKKKHLVRRPLGRL